MEFEEICAPVSRDSLTQRVAAQIQDTILNNRFEPGSRIPSERRLAELLGVSRIVVREAIKMLQQRGLLEVHSGRGTFVSELKPSTISESLAIYLEQQKATTRDLQEIRLVLETAMAAMAAQRATPSDLERIQEAIERHRRALQRMQFQGMSEAAFADFIYADIDFHYAIALASRNPLFVLFISTLNDLMIEVRRAASPDTQAISRALAYHEAIYQAIKRQEPEAARTHMLGHLEFVGYMVERRQSEQGGSEI